MVLQILRKMHSDYRHMLGKCHPLYPSNRLITFARIPNIERERERAADNQPEQSLWAQKRKDSSLRAFHAWRKREPREQS
jgi:hypothetical protein